MSLWSINAAKKKEEVPGTSKWIRKELFTLHDLMVNDAEQFAYSVATDLTWIDEQMEEILTATSNNPRLLLESPKKLRGLDSPVKQIRHHALAVKSPTKSPVKELDVNALRLSPVKFKSHVPPSPSPTRPQNIQISPLKAPQLSQEGVVSAHSALVADPYFGSPDSPESQRLATPVGKENSPDKDVLQPFEQAGDDTHGEYDASAEETSFQAIRTAIRKSFVQKSIPLAVVCHSSDNSFKSADEGPRPSSLEVNPTSSMHASEDGHMNASEHNVSTAETVKVPLKDEFMNRKKSFVSHTPPPQKRESQGFALLPHRAPLAVKSVKKKDNNHTRVSLFPDDLSSKESTETPPKTSLYPTLSLENTNPSTTTTVISPLGKLTREDLQQATKMSAPHSTNGDELVLMPSKIPMLSPSKFVSPPKLQSPEVSPPKPQNSPLSNLFASVNSTLKRAKSKFIRETQHIVDDSDRIHKVKSPKTDKALKNRIDGIKKWAVPHKDIELLTRLTVPTEASQAKTQKEITPTSPKKSVIKSPVKVATTQRSPVQGLPKTDPSDNYEDKHASLKFSPVKSIYGSLRREMNQSISPFNPEKKALTNAAITVSRNLTRVSLAKPDEKSQPQRKSFARGGLTGMTLEPKTRPRPKSIVGDQLIQPVKRKTQTEDEVRSTVSSQAFRKIGTKIVAPSTTQAKAEQDAKRRRTAEQLQNVLQKRAARVSQMSNQGIESTPEEEPPKTLKSVSKYAVSSNQTLMRTAVLHNARLNNEGKSTNPFQSNGSNFGGSKSNIPSTPKAPVALPEIFSESDDDEEGSVLKDWANSPELRHILVNQQHLDPDKVFGPVAPLQMEEIFHCSRTVSKFKHRGSSAQWTRDGLTAQEVENYKNRTFKR